VSGEGEADRLDVFDADFGGVGGRGGLWRGVVGTGGRGSLE
jgi:hypothetical protein